MFGRMFRRDENRKVVLVGFIVEISYVLVFKEILGKGGIWRVIFKFFDFDNIFLSRLNEFLVGEGMIVGELIRVFVYENGFLDLE